MLHALCLLGLVPFASAGIFNRPSAPKAATFAGSTSTFAFPPPNVTATVPDPNFPDAAAVGFPGATPTGDEAFAIETAPALAPFKNTAPIVAPDTADHKGAQFDVIKNWGNLAPMRSVDPGFFGLPDASPVVPKGCSINQVHILHRHGARYPTSGSAPAAFAGRIHNATVNGTGFTASGPLEFLNDWTFKLGAEILTPLGRQQLYELGASARVRYGDLLKGFSDLPVWRTTSEERMVDSASAHRNVRLQFAAGFFGVQQYQTSYHQLIEVEAPGFNTTLASYDFCNNSNNAIASLGSVKSTQWALKYTVPTIKRLSNFINGYNLTATDIIAMQQSCAYESVALGFSSFCSLFTEEEWESYEYFNDLSFWYGNGPGNPAVAAQGVGYVQEFISRLTKTRISTFATSVNESIVTDEIKFPLDQPIFVDASHDTIITAIAVALNLTSLASSGPLPTDHIAKRQWVVSNIAPFGTNLVAQVLSCPASDTPTHIRWILNDAVVPLTGVKGCKTDRNGLCPLATYIAGTQARIEEIDFQFDCFGNYTTPDPDTIIDGRFPPSLRNHTT
ncbi:phosphoglycerate mutase-like protein [Auriscalpium vulgare]|uniref:Phosphoglycerate mutase-like protein n=1 Tax=Auriscalpium vulgare TaxID=40419 RepID=A0ACB8RAZ2_9AGAM|nr:phosphoglycerate mutase-like protein [Auriscalpium vulgare]